MDHLRSTIGHDIIHVIEKDSTLGNCNTAKCKDDYIPITAGPETLYSSNSTVSCQ